MTTNKGTAIRTTRELQSPNKTNFETIQELSDADVDITQTKTQNMQNQNMHKK